MDFGSSQFLQLVTAIVLGTGFLFAAFVMSEKTLMWILLVFIPFQPISSRYGNINEFLVLAVAGMYFFRGRLKLLPLSTAVGLIMFAYVLSITQALPGTLIDHWIYVLAVFSNFALLWLVYNFIRREGDWQTILKILAVINVLILAYCAIQVSFGVERFTFLQSAELAFNAADVGMIGNTQRLTGPFDGTALIADYLAIQILIWGYFLIHVKEKRPRILVSVLIALNCGFLIATGNRGGIVALAVGSLCYLFLFRKELGLRRFVTISASAVLLFVAVSPFVIQYTEFNVLFERLANTEFERGFIPDSRAGWVHIWDQVIEKPFAGHGPRLGIFGYQQMPYPHNLFMFLFYTLGTVGFAAYTYFFWKIWRRFSQARRYRIRDKFLSGTPRLGMLILVVFVVSEMRIEFMRFFTHDFQQYIYMLLGMFLAFSDMVRIEALQSRAAEKKVRRRPAIIGTAIAGR
jgi:hypothetical protein